MGKSPRRSPRLNSDTMDVNNPASTPATSNTAVKKSTSQNDTVTATIVAGTASAPSVAPTSTGTVSRNSSTPSTPGTSTPISRQEAIMQAMQKRIAMLENSLKAAEVKLKEHESHIETVNASGSAYIAGMSAPQLPQIQQVVPLPDLQLPPNTGTNSQPLASLTDSRQLPISFATTTQNIYTNSDIHQSDNLSVNSNTPINANMGSVATHSSYLPRQMQALPDFCGKAEDWPMFYTAFTESTAVYGYSNFENNQRLHKCLKGEARETVKSLLIHPSNVNNIIEQLKFKFGRPEQLIRCQLAQVKEIAPITESGVLKLVSFATKVNNICIFLQSANGGDQHIANPTLLDDLVMKLPMSKRIEWATYAASIRPYATIVQFSQWLTRLANVISSVNDVELIRDPKRRVVLHAAESQRRQSCPICCGPHKTAECNKFIEFTVPRRWTETKNLRLCFSCLNAGHGTRTCQRRKPCSTEGCRRIHHKLLHEIAPLSTVTQRSSQEERQSGEESVLSCSTGFNNKKLLFRILPVVLYANHKRVETYALLDEGSSITMVDNALLQDLDLRGREQSLRLQWFGGRAAQEPAVVVDMFISGANMQKRHKLRNVYGVSNLQLPSQSLSRAELSCGDAYLRKLPVQTYSHIRPRLLIGLDHAHLGLPSFTMKMNRNGPFAANTALGWVVFGPTINEQQSSQLCLLMNNKRDNSLHKLVADYFDTESFGVRSSPPIESNVDVLARTILEKTSRCINGRFQIGLLWKHENVKLPNSYCMALRRLKSIENKMLRNVEFAAEYKRIIEYYIAKGYARKLSATEADLSSPRTWYLPHFAVSNPNKPGKLRLVFDAAAEVEGVSLNAHLLKGPQDYKSLPSILFHFRQGAIAVSGDIKEMFHQILVQPEDRCAQRFLWRNGESNRRPEVYEMSVMTFGAACSPCAAHYIKTVNALEHRSDDKNVSRAVKSILEHHYVDDMVDSFGSVEEAITVSKMVQAIHLKAGFELRNFASNSQKVMSELGGKEITRAISKKEGVLVEKVLGLFWQSSTDCFRFQLKFNKVDAAVINGTRFPTKRELLSVVMSIFDPLGFLCNFVVGAKVIMREVWKHNIHWDEPLPSDINDAWERWRNQLTAVVKYTIPRFYFLKGMPKILQLHVFVDASEVAFAAVAYWRSESFSGEIDVSFISAKSKCAPIKPLTVPRLELQAAVLGSRLMNNIRKEHSLDISQCVLWTDSKTVVSWIRCEHRRYKPFVQHRIAEILTATDATQWKWLPTDSNVADEATRTNNRIDFRPTGRWTSGPAFLHQSQDHWPGSNIELPTEDPLEEELRHKYALVIVHTDIFEFKRFSTFMKLVRVAAWVLRFIHVCRRRLQPECRYGLTAGEIELAKKLLCRFVQEEAFSTEIQQIKNGQNIASNSTLLQLSPYLDEEGVLRVNGRIDAASWLPISCRHPIILPPNHHFTRLLVMHYHKIMRHQNHEATICKIRLSFWIPRLRTLLRSIVGNCLACRIRKAQPESPQMGPLPVDRLTPYIRPFSYTGFDYFGPVTVTIGRSTAKRWVALFTCLTVRALHLELAHDLSTDSCIVVLRNFMNRRGLPIRLRSDNGKNFVGTDKEAKRFAEVFDCVRMQDELSSKGVEWVFNSPYNPAEGGAWERLVQCVKKVLRQTLKETAPKEHTLNCLLIEAENIINSRPLTHLPISVDEEQPLTPNDFLLGEPNNAQTPIIADITDSVCNLRQQWRNARQLRDRFWKRWIAEYLPVLTRRVKWCQPKKPIREGDLVFICDPNVPRREWCRGKVEKLYPGGDGQIRRADVRTSGGVKQRAVSKLAVLDISDGESG